jgi:hypothetical protein
MILSFTKELASLFALDLKASKSEVFTVTPVLDDWTMSCLWNREEHLGITLTHKHSLFSLLVVSEVKDLFYCLDLFYEQLIDLLTEMNLNDEKYLVVFDNLFQNINALKNDDKTNASQIKFIFDKLEAYEEQARRDNTKLHSIDISRMLNQTPRTKLKSMTPKETLTDLIKNHYDDQVLEIQPDETKQIEESMTIH